CCAHASPRLVVPIQHAHLSEEGDPRVSQQAPHDSTSAAEIFGGNEWLIEELYSQYKKDKHLVDESWWEFFETYSPADLSGSSNGGTGTSAPSPAATASDQSTDAAPSQRSQARSSATSAPSRSSG